MINVRPPSGPILVDTASALRRASERTSSGTLSACSSSSSIPEMITSGARPAACSVRSRAGEAEARISRGRGGGIRWSEPRQRSTQRVQAQGPEVQRIGVELAQVEVGSLPPPGIAAGLQPDSLADLVRRRLPRPAQVAIELEPQRRLVDRAVLHHELVAGRRRPPLARTKVPGVAGR